MVEIDEISDQIDTKKPKQKMVKQHIKYTDVHTPDNKADKDYTNIGDLYQILALLFGVITYFYRFKMAAWTCLLIFYCSVINMKLEDQFTQATTPLGFLVVMMSQCYIQPSPEQQARILQQRKIKENPESILSEK